MFADSGIENSLGISIDTRDEREQTEQARVLPATRFPTELRERYTSLHLSSLRKCDSAGACTHRVDPGMTLVGPAFIVHFATTRRGAGENATHHVCMRSIEGPSVMKRS